MLYHVASKIFGWVAAPEVVLLATLLVGVVALWTKWVRTARLIVTLSTLGFLVIACLPIGAWLLQTLENRFPAAKSLPATVDGIVVLGGASSLGLSIKRAQVTLNDNAERLTMFATLARRYPQARLVFSGGSGSLTAPSVREADIAFRLLTELGVDAGRIVLERQSRNTWENAVNSFKLVKPGAGQTWLLVTSARHIPRAVGAFRKAGWSIVPVPVDYRTSGDAPRLLGWNLYAGMTTIRTALHEWIGLVVYRAMDRSDEIFPAPAPRPTKQ